MKHSPRRYTTPRMGQYSTQKKTEICQCILLSCLQQ